MKIFFIVFFIFLLSPFYGYATQDSKDCASHLESSDLAFDKNNFYWQFPSDHLPAVGKVTLKQSGEQFKILTWNVQNENYFHYLLKPEDTQGLLSSGITEDPNRTETIFKILSEIMDDVSPSLMALQEVSPEFLAKLSTWAKAKNLTLVSVENPGKGPDGQTIDYGVILFSAKEFVLTKEFESVPFKSQGDKLTKYIQTIQLRTHKTVEFIFSNAHRFYIDNTVFTGLLSRQTEIPSIVVGDLNLEQAEVDNLLKNYPHYSRSQKPSNAFTHIDTKRKLVDYDHLLFSGAVLIEEDPQMTAKAQKAFQLKKRR